MRMPTSRIYGDRVPWTPGPFSFGEKSEENLALLDPLLVLPCRDVIEVMDFGVMETLRTAKRQRWLKANGRSLVDETQSLHCVTPLSIAMDLCPWRDGEYQWKDHAAFHFLAGLIQLAFFKRNKYLLRCGRDWNQNHNTLDQRFHDLGHFELPPLEGPR